MKAGIEATLGGKILAGIILDRDFRCDAECDTVAEECRSVADFVVVHRRKEIENFLLVPDAIDRAVTKRLAEVSERTGERTEYTGSASEMLRRLSDEKRDYVLAQRLAALRQFERGRNSRDHEATMNESGLRVFSEAWQSVDSR